MAAKFNKQIEHLIKELETLVPDIQKEFQFLGKEFIKQLKITHNKEQNPYGKKWKERKDNLPHPILKKSGKMFNSYVAYPRQTGVVLANKAAYSGYHDLGTSTIPVRQMLPGSQKGLPESWLKLIRKRIDKLIKKKFG